SLRDCALGVRARRIWPNDFVGTPCRALIGHFAVLNDVGQRPHRLRDRTRAHRAGPSAVWSRVPVARPPISAFSVGHEIEQAFEHSPRTSASSLGKKHRRVSIVIRKTRPVRVEIAMKWLAKNRFLFSAERTHFNGKLPCRIAAFA